jgi:hypothetical protein
MSKGYTINFFVNALKGVTNTQLNKNGVFNVVSPVYGSFSVKAAALDTFLGGNTSSIASGDGAFANLGKTPRTRLIKALKLRKQFGYVKVI